MSGAARLVAQVTARVGSLELDVALDTAGETLLLVGQNGAGKSTLLSLLLGAVPCPRGRIVVGDRVLLDTAAGIDVPVEERRLAYVPQDYALFPHLSVRDNVVFALQGDRELRRATRAELRERAQAALDALGAGALADRRPRTLSGGEQQRVALARALAVPPRALLLDEPLAALDVGARREVRAFLAETLARLALPTVVITHDAADLRALGGRVVVLEGGRVCQTGTLAEVCAQPASPFVAQLVAS